MKKEFRPLTVHLLLLLASIRISFAGGDTNIIAMSDWSKAVGTIDNQTLRGRMLIAQERSPAFGGPFPETEFYLELENVSSAIRKPMQIYFDPVQGLHCDVLDANSKPPPNAGGGGSGGGASACWITLPYDSTIRLRANMYGYGRKPGDGLLIQMSSGAMQHWEILPTDTNIYFMSGTFTAAVPSNYVSTNFDVTRWIWTGTLNLPKMKLSLPKR